MKKKTCFFMIGMASVLLAACSQNPKAPVAKQVPYVGVLLKKDKDISVMRSALRI